MKNAVDKVFTVSGEVWRTLHGQMGRTEVRFPFLSSQRR